MLQFRLFDESGNSISNFWQFDYGIRAVVEPFNETISEFHFANKNSVESIVVKPLLENGKYTVKIPDVLLKEALPITIYAYCIKLNTNTGMTIKECTIPVIQKAIKTHDVIETYGKAFLDGEFVVSDDNNGNVTISYKV